MARLSSAARAADRGDELDVDYSERNGFLTGKAAAIADWMHRKDKVSFEKVVAVLRNKKWRRENPELARDLQRRMDLRQRERRHAKYVYLTRGHVLTCGWCGAQWCRIPRPKMGPTPKYCSEEHGKAARWAQAKTDANKRAANVARAVAWQRANREKHRVHAREWGRRARAAKALRTNEALPQTTEPEKRGT